MKRNSLLSDIINNQKCLFLPDIGTFFNQDIELASSTIDKLVGSGIKVVKGEILHDINVCLNTQANEQYYSLKNKEFIQENYFHLISRKIVSLDNYSILFKRIKNSGAEFIVSVYDPIGADFALSEGAIAIKVASQNITNLVLIEHVSKIDLPLIMDTGHSSIEEISIAVSVAKRFLKNILILQHSPLGPPALVREHNLDFMRTLGNIFNTGYGLSDHHSSEEFLYAAAALGACIVEKGVCMDNLIDEQDRAHALNISKVKEVVIKLKNIVDGMGNGVRSLSADRTRYHCRMCIYALESLRRGDSIKRSNVGLAMPLLGIGAEYYEKVQNQTVNKDIQKGTPLQWEDLH